MDGLDGCGLTDEVWYSVCTTSYRLLGCMRYRYSAISTALQRATGLPPAACGGSRVGPDSWDCAAGQSLPVSARCLRLAPMHDLLDAT